MAGDGTGVLRVVATPGISAAVAAVAPGLAVELVPVAGPLTATDLRAAGWAEAVALAAAAGPGAWAPPDSPGVVDAEVTGECGARVVVRSPEGAVAAAEVDLGSDPRIAVRVACGRPLDDVVLRSYCVGAAHMALGWVCSEGLAVDEVGEVHDLTVRSLGILRAVDTPPISVEIDPGDGEPVNGSDAVFTAVAAAAWLAQGAPPEWPTGHSPRGRR
jgi:CO/xanthine dehydrogenase Mo-binding subunit